MSIIFNRLSRYITVLVWLLLFILFSSLSFAAKKSNKKISLQDWTMSGFIDSSYTTNTTTNISTFSLDEVEFDIERKLGNSAAFKMDINFFMDRNNDSTVITVQEEETYNKNRLVDEIVEQGYGSFDFSLAKVMIGKFNSPIGSESPDHPDMYQYSHSMIYDYGLPKNLTGVNLNIFFATLDVDIFMVNGWDTAIDEDDNKTIGGRVGITTDGGSRLGFSYSEGVETSVFLPEDPSKLKLLDIDYKYVGELITFGAEYNKGIHQRASAITPGAADGEWDGYLIMAKMGVSDFVSMTFSYDRFNDNDGVRLNKPSGEILGEERYSYVVAPSISMMGQYNVILEWRKTYSDKDVFSKRDGSRTDMESSFVVDVYFTF